MSSGVDALSIIASDIGVRRFVGESEESFCRRTSYSASRFWLQAFCMDDGEYGKKGLKKQAMNRRFKKWAMSLDWICPGIEAWLDSDGKGMQAIYNRLIDAGDLTLNGFEESYVATPPTIIDLSEGLSCVSGYFDPTSKHTKVCGYDVDSLVLSGLLFLARSDNGPIVRPASWWIEGLKYTDWENASGFADVRFADVRTVRWNINRLDVWVEEPLWVNDIALARVDGKGGDSIIFVAVKAKGRVRLSRITWIQAQELFFYLRRESGNGAISRYIMLDESHARAALPVGFVPGHINRVLDAMGWPVENAEDRFKRIVRAEALPLVEELLSASYIGFERASSG